ncbi:MAG: hypothetical protein D6712_12690 [Chloroflexi bacterium]|nr:MAG: hypothetical protein D6712_12690 [Chloroflexota bacterium]
MAPYPKPVHWRYTDNPRHWSKCERYTGADSLLSALDEGWNIVRVSRESIWYGAGRCVQVYHFTLASGKDTQDMAVIYSPYLDRLLPVCRARVQPASAGV